MISNTDANAFHEHYRHSPDVYICHRRDKFLTNLPPYIAFCTFACIHNPLSFGAQLILCPDPKPESFPQLVLKYKPNHFCCTRLHIDELMKYPKCENADLSFIYEAIYGGAKETSEWEQHVSAFLHKHKCQYDIINGYGMTETAGAFAVVHSGNHKMVPYVKNNVMIIDPDSGIELKYNEEGEVCVSSPTLMLGFYKNSQETERDLFIHNNEKWYHSGDIGSVSSDGELTIKGRIKRIYCRISKEGAIVRVYPMRIEEELSKSIYIDNCAVIGKKDNDVAFLSVAYIILKDKTANKKIVENELNNLCCDKLPPSHIPDKYVFIEEFPVTRAGKIDYKALEKMAEEMEK